MIAMVVDARYDGHADWYDEKFRSLGDETGSAGLLAELLGPPDADDPVCVDVGCGTGLHFAAVRSRGYRVVGFDLSADQLRVAASRNPGRVVRADARRLPLRDESVPAVVMTFIHTDVDGFHDAVGEAARVLRPGGRLVYLGVHPAFVGAFIDRTGEVAGADVRIRPGYGDERLYRETAAHFPIRSRVGSRNLTLATFLSAFLDHDRLRLVSVSELDTAMRSWRQHGDDNRLLPWNIAIVARRGVSPSGV
jgi:SAM-dependent methyltransferase